MIIPQAVLHLPSRWRQEANQLRNRYADEVRARVFELVAEDLDSVAAAVQDERLNLREAAAESGFTAGHLGRLVAIGKIPNAGRPNAPRIRRGDLPLKSHALPDSVPSAQIVGAEQIARSIVTQVL